MAQSHQPERDGEAEFVRRIVTDPKNVPDVMRLYGYLGASSEENHDRLYLNPDLSAYVEVPRGAILHRVAASAERDPNGAVVLWVRRDAALIYKSAPAAQALANYFAGAIAGAAAAGGAPAAAAEQLRTLPYPCPGTLPVQCTPVCPTLPPAHCVHGPTVEFVCTPACYSHIPGACINLSPFYCTPYCYAAGAAAAGAAGAVAGAAQPALLSAFPLGACPPRTFVECTQICPTHRVPCVTYEIVSCAVVCAPTPRGECPVSLAVGLCAGTQQIACQASPVGFCGGSVGAVCGPQGSIACGGSVACGAGFGQVGQGAAGLAAAAPQAAAFGYRTVDWLCFPTPACHFGAGVRQPAALAISAGWKCTFYCQFPTQLGIGPCPTPGCTTDICRPNF
jgi:hypothetical protein